MGLADDLQRRWYGNRGPPWWTLPPAALFGGVSTLRRTLYERGILRIVRLPVPVVVAGNIVAGGTGKTPLTIALVEALRTRGCKPGVVSRGHGGSARAPILLGTNPDPAEVGDEPVLVALRTGAPVAVGSDRPAAATLLLGEGVDVIVADDGLQHHALARDVEICVVDGMRRFGNGRLLPAGPLREPVARLRETDFVVCNGGTPGEGEVPMQLVADHAQAIDGSPRRQPLTAFAGCRVHAVAGIGSPARFFESLRAAGIEPIEHPFPDHHRFRASDFDFAEDLPVLMTEKDAVKCCAFAKPDWWSVPVTARLPDAFFDAVIARLSMAPRESALPSREGA